MKNMKERQVFGLLRKLRFIVKDYQNSAGISPGGESAVLRKLEEIQEDIYERLATRKTDEIMGELFDSDRVPIYRVPCSYTGLDAELDQCESVEVHRIHDTTSPISDGCVGRYITTDGLVFDCSIDPVDFACWFGLYELEEVDG